MQRWAYPTSIRFGPGAIDQLGAACDDAGVRRPLVVTDRGLAHLPPVASVDAALAATGIESATFADVGPNPVGADADAAIARFRDGAHDGVIAVGGGSAIDVGKIVALMAGQSISMWELEDVGDNWRRADAAAIAPTIAVPTTAGTGSEVGRASVITNEREGRKVIIFHPRMLPVDVIADPVLTVGLPPATTAGTGMDALSHSLEALCSPAHHPMSHGIGLEGCRLVVEHLPRVIADPGDVEARGQMLAAAAMGAIAFQKGLGAIHALAHPIGARFGTHHGTTTAVLMPYVLLANRLDIKATIEALAAYVGIGGGFDGFVEHVLDLRASIGIPHTLAALGVDAAAVDSIAAAAIIDPSAGTNPTRLTHELAAQIFAAAYDGTLDG